MDKVTPYLSDGQILFYGINERSQEVTFWLITEGFFRFTRSNLSSSKASLATPIAAAQIGSFNL